jgi:16S rRNA (cytidine1402-2'-O)-methyltransferase
MDLYVVALPIDGDWRTLDPRVVNCVRDADLLVAEERKNALRLLAAVESRDKEFILINEHSTPEDRTLAADKMMAVGKVVLVSDAGTPCISDPDYRLIDECRRRGANIFSVPGASSITAALSVSGFDASRFIFLGFPPRDKKARATFFKNLQKEQMTALFMERPYSLEKTLAELANINREISLSIALGTEQEKNLRGQARELIKQVNTIKEPYVVCVRGI